MMSEATLNGTAGHRGRAIAALGIQPTAVARALPPTYLEVFDDRSSSTPRRPQDGGAMTRDILFSATSRGSRIAVGPATDEELAAIARPILFATAQDVLLPSMLVSIRTAGDLDVAVHALGWRLVLANTWITSRLLAADLESGAVGTWSGKVYTLVGCNSRELPPPLHDHLGYALRLWGYDDVTAV